MSGVACLAGAPLAGHRAEKRDRLCLRREIFQRFFQGLGSGLHQGMMERVIHLHEPRENPIEFQLGSHRLQRKPGSRDRQ